MSANMVVDHEPQVFLFLSELLGEKIVDPEGRPIGRVLDLTGNIGGMYPPVTDILVRLEKNRRTVMLPWQRITAVNGTW
ncbi:MAG: hypothetical protein AAB112_09170, partial [Thermodesulfobacteriota bacterium]